MSAYSDERLMELVEAAALHPPEQRAGWLAAECPGETDLIADVLERAEWEDRMGGFLQEPVLLRTRPRAEIFAAGGLLGGRYRLGAEVGRGRASVVYEAFDLESARRVAIRVAEGEARSPGLHPAVMQILGRGAALTTEGPVTFFVLEYLEGPTLAERLKTAPLGLAEAKGVALTLCQALQFARTAGLSAAGLNTASVKMTERGPVLTAEWVRTGNSAQADAADLAALRTVLRRLARGEQAWECIVERCTPDGRKGRHLSLEQLEKDLTRLAG